MKHLLSWPSVLFTSGVLMLAVCTPLSAQPMPANAVHFTYGDAFLTGGDNDGAYVALGYERQLPRRLRTVVSLGYVSSVDRRFNNADLLSQWRDRKHVVGDIALHLDVLQFRTGGMIHRFGPALALSARYRWEERADRLYPPGLFGADTQQEEALLATCEAANVYCFKLDNSSADPFVLQTFEVQKGDIGVVGALTYSLEVDRVVVSLKAAYSRYRHATNAHDETHTYYHGVGVGYRF